MIYKAKYVIPMDGRVIEDGEVMVRDGRIQAVGARISESYPDEIVSDLGAYALLPGFVNAHSHIEYTMQRNRFDGLNLWDWLDNAGYRGGRAPDYDVLVSSAFLGAAECACSGITCLGDSSFSGAALEALSVVGLRGIVYREIFGQSMGAEYESMYEQVLRQIINKSIGLPDRLKAGISPHSIYTSNAEVLKLCARSRTELNVMVAVHLAETQVEADYTMRGVGPLVEWRGKLGYEPMISGLSPGLYLREMGLLRLGVALAHCVHVTDEEIGLIAESGAGVAHCPRSNALLGAGVAPLVKFIAAGANVGLGTDSAGSCLRLDFFEEMRSVLQIQRIVAKDASAIKAKDVLGLATIGGARSLGLGDEIGSLEPGKRADMIAVDLSAALPGEDVWLSILSRSPSDVALVVVDGIEVVRNGRLTTGDLGEHKERLRVWMEQGRIGQE